MSQQTFCRQSCCIPELTVIPRVRDSVKFSSCEPNLTVIAAPAVVQHVEAKIEQTRLPSMFVNLSYTVKFVPYFPRLVLISI